MLRKSVLWWVGAIGVLGLAAAFAVPAAQAGALYFSDAGGPLTWDESSTSDWSSTSGGPYGSLWADSSDAYFEGTAGTVNVSGGINAVNSLNFNTDGYTLNGGTINLTGPGGLITTGTGTDTIGSLLTGSVGLTKLGAGMLVVNAANTYSGNTNVTNGTLQIGYGGANTLPPGTVLTLGSTAGNSSGVFDLASNTQTLAGLLTAGGGSGSAVIDSIGGGGLKLSFAGTDTFGGQLGSGTANGFSFALAGGGLLFLTGTNNTYTLATTISSGTLSFSSSGGLGGSGPVVLGGTGTAGALQYTGGGLTFTRGFTLNGGGQIDNSGGGTLTISGSNINGTSVPLTVSGAGSTTISSAILTGGSLAKLGAGTLVLSNTLNNFSGGVNLAGGVLNFAANTLNLSNNTINFNGGTLQWATGNTQDVSGQIGISSSSQTAFLDTNGNNVTFATVIGGSGGLTKLSAGTLTTNVANTFTGALTVNGGIFATNSFAAPGTAQGMGKGSSLVLNGGMFRSTYANSNQGFAPTITLGTSGGTIDTPAGYLFFGGAFSGSGQLTAINSANTASAWILDTGNSPAFTGNVVIGNGVNTQCGIQYRSNAAYPLGTGTITVNSGGILTADAGTTTPSTLGNNIILNGGRLGTQGATMTYTGSVTLQANSYLGSPTTAVNPFTLTGPVGGTGGITKDTADTVTLSGSLSYTGPTTIAAGTLQIGTGGTIGSLSPLSAITDNATLIFNRSITLRQGTDFSASGIGGTGSFTQSGIGALVFNASNGYTGGTTTAGNLILDFTAPGAPASNILAPTGAVALSYGMTINGGTTGTTSQTVAGLTVNPGPNNIVLVNNGAAATNLIVTNGSITRPSAGAMLNFVVPASTSGTLGTSANAFLGPWAFYNGTSYAATGTGGVLQAATPTAESTSGINGFTSAAANYAYTSPGSPDVQTIAAATANSVVFSTAGSQALDLSAGSNTLTMNGFINAGGPLTILCSGGSGGLAAGSSKELVIGGTGNVTISVPIVNNAAGASMLTVCDSGTVISTGANTYSNNTKVYAGTLQIGNGTVNGTIGSGTYAITSGARLYLDYNTYPAPTWANISGSGTFELNSAQAVNGTVNWGAPALPAGFTGTLQLDNGRINLVPSNLGGATAVVLNNGSQFLAYDGTNNGTAYTFPQNFSISGMGWGESGQNYGALRSSGMNATFSGNITLTGSAGIMTQGSASNSKINVTGNISGPYNLTINAESGPITLAASNSYTGGTTLGAGQLNIANSAALSSGMLTMAGGNFDNTTGGPLTLTANNPQVWNSNFTYVGSANSMNMGTGTVSLPNSITATVSGNTLTVGGNIGGTGSLTKAGTGALVLGGSNSYTGTTTVSSGTLVFNSTSNQTYAGVISGGGEIYQLGPGTVTSNQANTFTGLLTIGGGVFATNTVNTINGRRAWARTPRWPSTAARTATPAAIRAATPAESSRRTSPSARAAARSTPPPASFSTPAHCPVPATWRSSPPAAATTSGSLPAPVPRSPATSASATARRGADGSSIVRATPRPWAAAR